ncbi:PREDICTED: peptidyl-prolyl cis-trans isomerase FKBP17-3, chloroplastic-like [Camelina sativa]|uniref:peptidylprolyl isomerase n=1 Tax=Camelina sativa TaxID=90675 RepID=A0ABM0WI69_CAMSA|nr:PREDICTED: peptidyl-prolyl cis-trans isomerase FKBP17-3, chloroplastic-like [Camelina sativa]
MATLFSATVPSHHRFVSPSQHPKQSLPSQSLSVALQGNLEPAVAVTLPEQQMTDWMASPVTRRFGIGAGLTWSGFLAFGVVSEQKKKSPLNVFQEEDTTRGLEKQEEIILPNGIRYYDLQAGSGATPSTGYLVVFDVKGKVHGTEQVFVDTFGSKDKKKSLAMVMDSRPYSKGVCEGIEYVLRSMKAGGKRRVIIPPSLGFGSKNVEFGPGLQIPPSATLDYTVEVDTVYCFQTIV